MKKQKKILVTGDFVEFEKDVITKILPRKTYIKRPAIANIEQIIIVTALKEPELDLHQLNRFISLTKYYKIPAILCFNKEDLGCSSDLQDKICGIYEPLGFKVLFTSALQKIGIKEFENILSGKLSAMCGNSGVGKSSLINALNPTVKLKTKAVTTKLGRGTHTTRHCEIIKVSDNISVIDTPGFSNMKFDFILPKDVDMLFDEIFQYKHKCKFSDCLHINETGCEVIKHLRDIDFTRYQSYVEFVKEAYEYKDKIKYNGIKEETFEKYNNNKTVAKISEKKRSIGRNTNKQKIYKEYSENVNE